MKCCWWLCPQNYAGLHIAHSRSDGNQLRSHEPTIKHLLDQIMVIASRHAVAGEDAMIRVCGSR